MSPPKKKKKKNAGASDDGAGDAVILSELTSLGAGGDTGVLRVQSVTGPGGEIYLMSGDVIACCTPTDALALGQLLVRTELLDEAQLAELMPRIEAGEDLSDMLMAAGLIDGQKLGQGTGTLFLDNLAWTLAAPEARTEFEAMDAVFPANMQFGLDQGALLSDVERWLGDTTAVRALVGDESKRFKAKGKKPKGLGKAQWTRLKEPMTVDELLVALNASRREAAARIAELLKSGALIEALDPDPKQPAEAPAPTEAAPAEAPPADDAPIPGDPEDEEALAEDVVVEEMQTPSRSRVDPVGGPDPVGDSMNLDTDEDEEAGPEDGGGISAEHYEKAARGGFVKSYDHKDKVDLSGMEVFGANKPFVLAGAESDVEVVALGGEMDDSAFAIAAMEDDGLEVEALSADPSNTVTAAAGKSTVDDQLGEIDDDDFDMFDEGFEDADDDFEFVQEETVAEGSIPEEALASITQDSEPLPSDPAFAVLGSVEISAEVLDGPFDQDQLDEFQKRIGIFNNIFRIIFGTFSEHIGGERSQQRFNALLGSGQRQYPELFKGVVVEGDGSIRPNVLVKNLAHCPPGDFGALLHQGLYELIFSHLYDAKDMLPGDAETGMMEKIVVYERQLHNP